MYSFAPYAETAVGRETHLLGDRGPLEEHRRLGGVSSQAANEMRPRVHQRAQQIVEPRMEVLRERGSGRVVQRRRHCGRRAELRTLGPAVRRQRLNDNGSISGDILLSVISGVSMNQNIARRAYLEFGSEKMSGEAEFAGARVERGEQLVGHGVAVGLEKIGRVVSHFAAVVPHREPPRVRHARVSEPRVPSAGRGHELLTRLISSGIMQSIATCSDLLTLVIFNTHLCAALILATYCSGEPRAAHSASSAARSPPRSDDTRSMHGTLST